MSDGVRVTVSGLGQSVRVPGTYLFRVEDREVLTSCSKTSSVTCVNRGSKGSLLNLFDRSPEFCGGVGWVR